MKLTKKIQNFNFQNNLWQRGNKIVVGVSGGPDSVCLLIVFLSLAKKYDLSLHVVHVNYGLRGEDSKKDEKFVKNLVKKNNIAVSILNVGDEMERFNKKNVSENSLREIRYEFFEKIRRDLKYDLIAVAHNKNDQAETVIMHILRGTGLQGVSAIRPKNKKIIRPLLSISRKEIMEFLKDNKLKYRTDKTNLEPFFLRNKIRLELLPYLEKAFNPKIQESLASFALSSAEDFDFIDKFSEKKCNFKYNKKENQVDLEVEKLLKLHPAILRQCLRRAVLMIKKDLKSIEFQHVEEMVKIIKSQKNKSQIMKFAGLKLARKGGIIRLSLS